MFSKDMLPVPADPHSVDNIQRVLGNDWSLPICYLICWRQTLFSIDELFARPNPHLAHGPVSQEDLSAVGVSFNELVGLIIESLSCDKGGHFKPPPEARFMSNRNLCSTPDGSRLRAHIWYDDRTEDPFDVELDATNCPWGVGPPMKFVSDSIHAPHRVPLIWCSFTWNNKFTMFTWWYKTPTSITTHTQRSYTSWTKLVVTNCGPKYLQWTCWPICKGTSGRSKISCDLGLSNIHSSRFVASWSYGHLNCIFC